MHPLRKPSLEMNTLQRFLDFPSLVISASDVRLQAGQRPWVNINRRWMSHPYIREEVTVQEMKDFILQGQAVNDETDLRIHGRELDFAFSSSVGEVRHRFRAHESQNYQGTAIDVRILRERIDSFEELGFRHGLAESLLEKNSGLLVIGGPTGSGKSTTLATLVQTFGRLNPGSHIVTLEDPVEYLIEAPGCLVSQKHVPIHVRSWSEGVFLAKREKPDLIVIGEMRSAESIRAAVEAAGSGHLVMATTFADRIPRVFEVLRDAYATEEHESWQRKLSYLLRGVICQSLVSGLSTADSFGTPQLIYESLVNDQPGIRSAVQKGLWANLDLKSYETKGFMMTWETRIQQLLFAQRISPEVAEIARQT